MITETTITWKHKASVPRNVPAYVQLEKKFT